MKKIIFLLISTLFIYVTNAQVNNPVSWTFTAKKNTDKTFEVHLTAALQTGWHIYSQTTPDDGPVQTKFFFTNNPLIIVSGIPKEIGKLEQKHEPLFGVDVKQYSKKVDFVIIAKLKTVVKTSFIGSVEYMVCNDRECLPPKTVNFIIPLK